MISFYPNCTLPTEAQGFVAAANVRSTMDIVWTCLSTIVLSCWSALHLNVPPQFNPTTTAQRWRYKGFLLLRKVKFLLVMLIAPELLLSMAIDGWWFVHRHTPILQKLADEDGVPWSKSHTFFSNMGGFVVRFSAVSELPSVEQGQASTIELVEMGTDGTASLTTQHSSQWTTPSPERRSHSRFNSTIQRRRQRFKTRVNELSKKYGPAVWNVHGVNESIARDLFSEESSRLNPDENLSSKHSFIQMLLHLEGDAWVLTSAQLAEARRRKIIRRLPDITEQAIADKSKGELVVKLLALVQVVWLVAQMAARQHRSLSSSPLEVMTLAFAVCAFIIYILLLGHPQDVMTPIYIQADSQHVLSLGDMEAIAQLGPYRTELGTDLAVPHDYHSTSKLPQLSAISNLSILSILGSGAALFGGIHLIAWDFPFHTFNEQLLWKVSSFVTMLAPGNMILLILFAIPLEKVLKKGNTYVVFLVCGWAVWVLAVGALVLLALALLLARFFLICEAFISLYYLPPDAYYATWTASAPRIG
ncbi:hypothetical protein B0H63DRAFT_487102 [Podospora didyma]|uniref:Uncharacterized protein n=1 Tax=Podospora didyma TaxID=330526 RepID=A0AAE0K616_9PEZI|nr:hypothetical protein B0H63DRAFT_487102 [Podospora didyma]